MRPIPFRDMRLTLRTTQAQLSMLLGLEGMEWTQNDYIMFFAMNEMWKHEVNPTYKRMVGIVGAYLRHYRKLIGKLEDGSELRLSMQAEWDKLAEPYKELLDEQQAATNHLENGAKLRYMGAWKKRSNTGYRLVLPNKEIIWVQYSALKPLIGKRLVRSILFGWIDYELNRVIGDTVT